MSSRSTGRYFINVPLHKILNLMCFSQKRDQKPHGRTNGRADYRTYPLKDMTGRI